jgi:hypothetical protein
LRAYVSNACPIALTNWSQLTLGAAASQTSRIHQLTTAWSLSSCILALGKLAPNPSVTGYFLWLVCECTHTYIHTPSMDMEQRVGAVDMDVNVEMERGMDMRQGLIAAVKETEGTANSPGLWQPSLGSAGRCAQHTPYPLYYDRQASTVGTWAQHLCSEIWYECVPDWDGLQVHFYASNSCAVLCFYLDVYTHLSSAPASRPAYSQFRVRLRAIVRLCAIVRPCM